MGIFVETCFRRFGAHEPNNNFPSQILKSLNINWNFGLAAIETKLYEHEEH